MKLIPVEHQPQVVYDYKVSFVGDDMSVNITITEDTDDFDHEDMVVRAEKMLCEMWGVAKVPDAYAIVNIDVYEVTL